MAEFLRRSSNTSAERHVKRSIMNTGPHTRRHLALWLPAIFGAFHFIALGLSILDADWRGGEGLGYAMVLSDGPLLALCQHHGLVDNFLCGSPLSVLLTGTLMYAVVGFVIGAVIDWIRALIARRWS